MSPSGDEDRDGEDPPRWYCGSRVQKPPLPGSSFERATLMKHLLSDRLCRIEFCKEGNQERFEADFKDRARGR